MERKKAMTAGDRQHYKSRLLIELTQHVGRAKAVGMGELYESVFGEKWLHRINDTRRLRTLITELRREGVVICSAAMAAGGGYWIASAGSELSDYCERLEGQAIKKLAQSARLKKVGLPDLLGQLQVELR